MYKSLQACRAVTGMLVALYHLGGAFGADKYFGAKFLAATMSLGHHSVIFFFVLSGFTLIHNHQADFGNPRRLGSYLKKRLTRIYPSYLTVLLCVHLVARNVPALADSVPHDPWTLIKTMLLLPQDASVVGGTGAPILIVAWSLQYEVVFYAVIACFVFNRILGYLVMYAILVNYLDCHWHASCGFPRSFVSSNYILPFFFGATVAYLVKRIVLLKLPMRVALWAISVMALARGIDVLFGMTTFTAEAVFIYGVPSAVLIFGLVKAEMAGLLTVPRCWQVMGSSSYALYLIHYPIISLFTKMFMVLGTREAASVLLAFCITFIACVASAIVFHRYVEKPMFQRLSFSSRSLSEHSAVVKVG